MFLKNSIETKPNQEATMNNFKIKMSEIVKNADLTSLSNDILSNLTELQIKVNKVREAYGKPLTVTSGLRTMEDHLRIYKDKGITDQSKIPMKSKHLSGEAVDFSDPKQELQAWCLANVAKLEEIGLWCEDFSATKNWVHFQSVPPKSGNRFFKP